MLHLPSRHTVISFAIDGIAIKTPNSSPRIIHRPDQNRYKNFDELIMGFSKVAPNLQGKAIRFVLSNYFVRLSILSWQENIYKKTDWVALADYELKQKTLTNAKYETSVRFNGYKKNIMSASMSSSCLAAIKKIASLNHIEILMIEPFFNSILNKKKGGWILIAELGKAMLLECSNKNWMHISSTSILENKECDAIDAFIQRRCRLDKNLKNIPKVSAFLYPKLSHDYRKNKKGNSLYMGVIKTHHFPSNAEWMAHF